MSLYRDGLNTNLSSSQQPDGDFVSAKVDGLVYSSSTLLNADEQITTSYPFDEEESGGIVLTPGTDYKFKVESVSDNNTDFSARLEHLTIKR